MPILKNIVHSGITADLPYREKRHILLTNYISLILSAAFFILIFLRQFVFQLPLSFIHNFFIVIFLVPLILNRLSLTRFTGLVLCIAPVLAIWYVFVKEITDSEMVEQSMFDGLRIFLISLSLIPYLVIDRNRYLILSAGVFPTLLSIIFFDKIMGLSFSGYSQVWMEGSDFHLMTMRTIVAYLIVNSICFILLLIVSNNDDFNHKLITELHRKSEQIRLQNIELSKSKQELIDINQYLERLVDDKTKNIKRQNEILANYAFTNAHKLRGPVARILGLINISRFDSDLNYSWFFTKVEQETQDIDKVIKSISEDLNQTGTE